MILLRQFRLLAVCLTAVSALFTTRAQAAAPQFPTLTEPDFHNIIREMSANGLLHSATPPASYGSIFGFELGVVGGATRTQEIEAIVKRGSPGTESQYLPHAGLLGAVTIPFGITGEAVVIPQTEVSGIKYQQYALAVKWTATDTVLSFLPVNIALRGFLSKTEMSYSQTINNASTSNTDVSTNVKYDGSVTGLHVFASPKLIPILEPYLGLGVVQAKGKMNSSVGTIFGFGTGPEAEYSPTSTHFLLGLDVRLLLIGFGVEYNRAFDTDSYTAKFSLKF